MVSKVRRKRHKVRVRKKKKNTRGIVAYYKILDYLNDFYGDVGRVVGEDLILSLISLKCEKEIRRLNISKYIRYRRHIMLCWEVGRAKSTFLRLFNDIIPDDIFKSSILSESSPEALRGGVFEGYFIPPEFRVNDIVIVPELSSLLKTKDDVSVFNGLLTSLEDGEYRVKLLKLGAVNQKILEEADAYGVDISDGSMQYVNDAIMWMATYDMNTIPPALKSSIVDRFFVKKLPITRFDCTWLKRIRSKTINKDDVEYLKGNVRLVLNDIKISEEMINMCKEHVNHIVDDYFKSIGKEADERIHLRFIGELDRVAIAYMSLTYNLDDWYYKKKFDTLLMVKFKELLGAGITTKDYIYDLILDSGVNGMTVPELHKVTGYNTKRIRYYLNGLHSYGIKRVNIKFVRTQRVKNKRVKYVYICDN